MEKTTEGAGLAGLPDQVRWYCQLDKIFSGKRNRRRISLESRQCADEDDIHAYRIPVVQRLAAIRYTNVHVGVVTSTLHSNPDGLLSNSERSY